MVWVEVAGSAGTSILRSIPTNASLRASLTSPLTSARAGTSATSRAQIPGTIASSAVLRSSTRMRIRNTAPNRPRGTSASSPSCPARSSFAAFRDQRLDVDALDGSLGHVTLHLVDPGVAVRGGQEQARSGRCGRLETRRAVYFGPTQPPGESATQGRRSGTSARFRVRS